MNAPATLLENLRTGRKVVAPPSTCADLRCRFFLGAAVVLFAVARLPAANIPTAIFVMKVDGSDVRRVAQVDGYKKHGSPQWSHDGHRLAFDAYEGPAAAQRFFVINIDGTGLYEMGEHALPHWSPDDKQLAYQNYGNAGVRAGIWVKNSDGRARNWLADGFCPRWSPDGSRIAFLVDYRELHALDLINAEQQNLLDEEFTNISGGFAWSPDGQRLAFVADRNNRRELLIVDAGGKNPAMTVRHSGDLSGNVDWSPDGKQLAFSINQRIHLADADSDKPPALIAGQQGSNREPVWSPDGRWIAFSSERKADGPPQKARIKRGLLKLEEQARHEKGSDVCGVAFTPDGRRIIIGGDLYRGGLHVWNVGNGETQAFDLRAAWLAISTDGRQLATAALTQKIQLVNLETGAMLRELHPGDITCAVCYSADGTRLASGGLDKRAVVWNSQTGKEVCTFRNHQDWVTRVAFTPDGKNAVSVSHDKTLRVWDATTAAEKLSITHPEPVWALAVSPDGRWILTGTGGSLVKRSTLILHVGIDNALRLWDATTGGPVREMKGHTDTAFTADISPDGDLAVSGSFDGSIRLWDLETGAELSRIQGAGSVMQVKFSPDGRQVIVGGGIDRTANGRLRQIPEEQVRLYQLIEIADGNPVPPPEGK